MLRITAYTKTFDVQPVLAIPHLELEKNVFWLKGENGSGKTTFLKSVAGLIPFDGEIDVDGISLKNQRRLYTAIVNHAAAEPLYPSFLTGNDLVRFYVKAKGGSAAAALALSKAFCMTSYLDKNVGSYSSGMTKKLSLLLAFTGKPKLILLDEPFTTLDVQAVQVLQTLIEDGVANDVSFCISSHQFITLQHASLSVKNKTIEKD